MGREERKVGSWIGGKWKPSYDRIPPEAGGDGGHVGYGLERRKAKKRVCSVGGSRALWDALGRSGTLWDALGCSGMLWDALGCSAGPCPVPVFRHCT